MPSIPDDEAIIRLVSVLLPETGDERAVARRHMRLETMARIPTPDTPDVGLPAVAA